MRVAAIFAAALLLAPSSPAIAQKDSKLDFWEHQRKGANSQNRSVTPEYWRAARAAGIQFVRLVPNAWPTKRRDFLIGDADAFKALDAADLASLRAVLKDAHRAGVKVVLTTFSLPGARWRQLNGDKDDFRLWTKPGYHEQAFEFWRQLAAALRGDSAIVAYNPLNEPHPERAFGISVDDDPDPAIRPGADRSTGPGASPDGKFNQWLRGVRGTPADLNAFNRGVVAAIRKSDPETPIILDGWGYSSPVGLVHLEPVDDPAVLYAFHNFGPWDYTTFRVNRGRYRYPDRMPAGWTRARYGQQAEAVATWAGTHQIPQNRIIAEEFWVDRRVGGAQRYLEDIVSLLDRRQWHWAFYSFRGDGDWGGLDYELGTKPLGAAYWDALKRGEDVERLKRRGPNPLWNVLARALASP